MGEEKTSSVLIADDNTNNLRVLANILESDRIKVATVRDGIRAMKFIEKKKPDLVLMDVLMPGMDGYRVCARLKEQSENRDIPVIFISALNQTEDKLKGFECGGVDYITKPFRREEVLARVNAQLTLKHALEELRNANAAKDKLFSIVAHDLRGPIASLAGMLEVIVVNPEMLGDDDSPMFLNELAFSARTLLHLIENLLSWAKNQRDAITYKPETICVNDIIDTQLNIFSGMAREKGVNLKARVDARIHVFADSDTIMTVMRNLLSNALKFTSETGEVEIGAERQGDIVEISIGDTGVGIPAERLETLFQGREQTTTFGTRNEKGSGLGLLLCKEFVENNGGTIRAESEPSKGSRFIFTLPASDVVLTGDGLFDGGDG